MMDDQQLYREARQRVQQKVRFYKHLYTYVIFVGLMFFLTLLRGRPFAFLPLAVIWGVFVLFHYLKVFGIPGSGILSNEWEEKEIEKEVRRLKRLLGKEEITDETELLDDEMKLKEMRKNYDESELV